MIDMEALIYVIARSEATRQSFDLGSVSWRLLRCFAPRNDLEYRNNQRFDSIILEPKLTQAGEQT
jgi:hypothetical protein